MTLREFIKGKHGLDISNRPKDSHETALVTPINLTAAGRAEFVDLLDLDVKADEDTHTLTINTAKVDDKCDEWKARAKHLNYFLAVSAGDIDDGNYAKYFEKD
jgi:hypothetical protein